jgi:hypothetical protein
LKTSRGDDNVNTATKHVLALLVDKYMASSHAV